MIFSQIYISGWFSIVNSVLSLKGFWGPLKGSQEGHQKNFSNSILRDTILKKLSVGSLINMFGLPDLKYHSLRSHSGACTSGRKLPLTGHGMGKYRYAVLGGKFWRTSDTGMDGRYAPWRSRFVEVSVSKHRYRSQKSVSVSMWLPKHKRYRYRSWKSVNAFWSTFQSHRGEIKGTSVHRGDLN